MDNQYFASVAEEEIGDKLADKVKTYRNAKSVRTLMTRLTKAYQYHFGFSPSGVHVTSGVQRNGEQGELAEIRINHLRANALTVFNLTVAPKIAWTPVATNADSASTKQAFAAVSVLEYYWLDRQIAQYAFQAVCEAIPLSEGFVFTPWDDEAGDVVGSQIDPTTGEEKTVRTGDFSCYNVQPWDVIRDPSKKAWNQLDWVIICLWRNKYDLAARCPDKAEDILRAPNEPVTDAYNKDQYGETDDIPVYYFFHKRCPVAPKGRETMFLSDGTTLLDGTLTYTEIPLHRVAPDELVGTPYGYTQYHEGIGIQEAVDSLESAILTNQDAFARQMIAVRRGEPFSPEDIGGVKVLMYSETEPKALQLTQSPAEAFRHLDILKADLRRIQGVNDAVQGQLPGDAKLSGAALALLSSQAIQQNSILQANYVRMVRSIGCCLLNEWKKRTPLPRKIKVVGKSSAFLCREESFSGEDVSQINDVNVDIGNPMQQTQSGKLELAQLYIQSGGITSPEQIEQVVSTGKIEHLTKGLRDELILILDENEAIGDGQTPVAVIHDDHLRHGREHKSTMSSVASRSDAAIVKASIDHLHQHYKLFFNWPPPGFMPPPPPIDPQTGLPDQNFDATSPVLDPNYHNNMLILVGQQPPPPPMMMGPPPPLPGPPHGAPPGPTHGAPPGPTHGAIEHHADTALKNQEPAGNKTALPSMPKNPQTGDRYVPPGGQSAV